MPDGVLLARPVLLASALLVCVWAGCAASLTGPDSPTDPATDPADPSSQADPQLEAGPGTAPPEGTDPLRATLLAAGAVALEPLPPAPDEVVALGRALFWDPVLSGPRDTACATCHHPDFALGDGLPLAVGTGASGTGLEREPPAEGHYVACNAPSLFHRGGDAWHTMFFDGRVFRVGESTYPTPIPGYALEGPQDALSALAHYPVVDRQEMRGQEGSLDIHGAPNEIAALPMFDLEAVWAALMQRLLALPGYRDLLAAAFPDEDPEALHYTRAADAISAYIGTAFHPLDSPWDRYLAGEDDALDPDQRAGAALFYGEAGCATCHSGPLLTDQAFHNLAVPYLRPGPRVMRQCRLGRANMTDEDEHLYVFRTPPLRAVADTGPWFHNGSFDDLHAVVRHHLDPAASLDGWAPPDSLPARLAGYYRAEDQQHAALLEQISPLLPGVALDATQVDQLVAFLHALSPADLEGLQAQVPDEVPSGLPIPSGAGPSGAGPNGAGRSETR